MSSGALCRGFDVILGRVRAFINQRIVKFLLGSIFKCLAKLYLSIERLRFACPNSASTTTDEVLLIRVNLLFTLPYHEIVRFAIEIIFTIYTIDRLRQNPVSSLTLLLLEKIRLDRVSVDAAAASKEANHNCHLHFQTSSVAQLVSCLASWARTSHCFHCYGQMLERCWH